MAFKELISQSKNINKKFQIQWGIETRLVNLTEEVGELAHDVLVKEGQKKDQLHTEHIGDNLTNLLYEIFMIADHYQVDLDQDWQKFIKVMPSWVEKRNE